MGISISGFQISFSILYHEILSSYLELENSINDDIIILVSYFDHFEACRQEFLKVHFTAFSNISLIFLAKNEKKMLHQIIKQQSFYFFCTLKCTRHDPGHRV